MGGVSLDITLTIGITINGTIIAMLAEIGDLAGPKRKKSIIAVKKPLNIPINAADLEVFFQNNPYMYGAIKEPATAPQESDIRVTITLNLYVAIIQENKINIALTNLIRNNKDFSDIFF